MSRMRFVLRVLLVSTLAAGLAVVAAPQALASFRTDSPVTWAYTDARAPLKSFVDGVGDAPVGGWRDSYHKLHLSKSYFTFDLAQLRGARIIRATAFTAETQANDCGVERATQLWLTGTATRPTWARAPRELARWDTQSGAPCLSPRVEWDVADGLGRALAAGQTRFTVAMRISADRQNDFRYGRRYDNSLRLTIEYNLPPNTPVELSTATRPCADGTLLTSFRNPELAARISDPDGDNLFARFILWPVDNPSMRTELPTAFRPSGSVVSVVVAASLLEHGKTYEWQVQADDGLDVSPPSAPCRFTTDFAGPSVAPTVFSEVYPEECESTCGGAGVPGDFTFTANGEPDVVGFFYGPNENPSSFVAADRPGGQATITFTPPREGFFTMNAQSVDAAGNKSAIRSYRFFAGEL